MRAVSTTLLLFTMACSGCASGASALPPADPARYQSMSCAELNVAMGETASRISKIAISRGRIAKASVPRWVLGGSKVVDVVKERETAQIEKLRLEEAAIDAARKSRC